MRDPAVMMNFLFGTVAGGLIACVATIAAARHPEVQTRLGLVPVVSIPSTPAALSRAPTPCAPVTKQGGSDTGVGQPEMLFSRQRFWSVAP